MSRAAAIGGGLLVTLSTPATWPLALAAFLLRGGIVLFVLPIIVLPTPVGIGTAFGPMLTAVALGRPPLEALIGAGLAVAVVLLWLVGAGWLAAALEAEGARIVASNEDVAAGRGAGQARPSPISAAGRSAARILAARLLAHVPFLVVLTLGSVRLVYVAYDELTSPVDVTASIVVRVLRGAPEVVAAVALTWMAGEMVGAVAARRIVVAGDGVGRALAMAVGSCLRHPVTALARFWVPTLVLIVVIVPAAVAAGSAWSAVVAVLDDGGDPVPVAISVVALVGLWVVGLLLASVLCAWRAAVWTVAEVLRQRTFGGSSNRRPGDWRPEGSSATL